MKAGIIKEDKGIECLSIEGLSHVKKLTSYLYCFTRGDRKIYSQSMVRF